MEILCLTILAIIVIYWIMPTKKMRAVNKELKSLLQVFPVTGVINAVMQNKKKSDDTSKEE